MALVNVAFRAPRNGEGHGRTKGHIRYIATHAPILKGQAVGENAAHVRYMATHQAHGGPDRALFGPVEGEVYARRDIYRALDRYRGIVWRSWLTLRADEAEKCGWQTREDWERLARAYMPQVVQAMGLNPATTRWVAALHHLGQPGKHPHLHVIWWDEARTRERGVLNSTEMRAVKQAWVREALRPFREQVEYNKTLLREALRDRGKQRLGEVLELARTLRGRIRLSVSRERELYVRLLDLADKLPGKGRVALAYMPGAVKAEARSVADWLLQQPEFCEQVAEYLKCARELAEMYSQRPVVLAGAEDRAYNDLRDRVAQQVLRGAVRARRAEREWKWKTRQEIRCIAYCARSVVLAVAQILAAPAAARDSGRALTEQQKRRRADGRGRDF